MEEPAPDPARLADASFVSALLECPGKVERGSEGPLAVSVTNGLATAVELYLDGCRKHERLGRVSSAASRGFVLPRSYTTFADSLRIHVHRAEDGAHHATLNLPAETGGFVPLAIDRSRSATIRSPGERKTRASRPAPGPEAPAEDSAPIPRRLEETFSASTVWSVARGAALTVNCRPNEGPTVVLSPGRRYDGPVELEMSFGGGGFLPTTDSWSRVRSLTDGFVADRSLTGDVMRRMSRGDLLIVRLVVGGESRARSGEDVLVFVPPGTMRSMGSFCTPPPGRS